jgi:integrase
MARETWTGSIARGIRRIVLHGQERYRVQLMVGGRRRSRVCRTLSEAVALYERWRRGDSAPPDDRGPAAERATVDDGLRHRALDLRRRGKSASVTERIRLALRTRAPEFAEKSLTALRDEDLEAYVERERTLGTKVNNTIVRELREWRAMLKKARPDYVFPGRVFPPENLTRIRVLPPELRTKVFDVIALQSGPRFARMALLALLGVVRQAEVRTLRRSMVRLSERVLLLPRQKGGTPRAVRLSEEAAGLLEAQMAEHQHDYLFADPRTGRPYSRYHVWRTWHRGAQSCGLEDFTFHDLRHHGPTLAANAGANEYVINQLGGWKKGSPAAQRYVDVLNPTLDRYLALIAAVPAPQSGPASETVDGR